jgi:hypothetical protein
MFSLLILLAVPALLSAKGTPTRITVNGGDLRTPIEITDPAVLERFNVWAGPGVRVNGIEEVNGFIIDWSSGVVAERPAGLRHYEVSFYVKYQNRDSEQVAYVVAYECGASAEQGYVYLPGKGDEWYLLNTTTILRGREGKWFRATNAWQQVVTSLIASARYLNGK